MKDLATNTRDKPSQIFAQCDDNVCLNGCGGTEKVPSMKMVWALANLSKLSGE
jgi:hypothetical protein